MKQATTKALYAVHAWTGIVTGLLLFVICFSGAVVVFKHELDLWANPGLQAHSAAPPLASLDTVVATLQSAKPDARIDSINLPTGSLPAFTSFVTEPDGSRVKLALHPQTGELLGPVESELGQFIRSLHVFLLFGPRWIVGFMGLVMLASIVTGVLIHQKILKDLFTQRWTSSLRLMLSDAHKLIGVWALLFHVLIALTGAWLGLAPVVMTAARHLADGPPPSVTPAVIEAPVAGHDPMPLNTLFDRAQTALPSVRLQSLRLVDWNTPAARAQFSGPAISGGGLFGGITLRAADGHAVQRRDPRDAGFWARVNGWMEPLHFGDFGGLTLKWLYFILGLTPALLSISGTWLWLDRQRQGGALP